MEFTWYSERVNAILATFEGLDVKAETVAKWTKLERSTWLAAHSLFERSDAIWSQVIKELA